ncbi:MAG: glycosyltransferase family 2 protein, partial [Gammaproteobacteria bacterium]
MNAIILCFWASVAVLAYSYLGYPALVWLWARLRPRPGAPAGLLPRLSVVIVAHNEARQIEHRIENVLKQDYPPERLDVIMASDGSHDETAAHARRVRAECVRVVEFATWRGKSAVLNEVIPWAQGDIVVLTDARQRFAPGALRALSAHFADPDVGAVGGELMLAEGPEGSEVARGVDAYWRYEKFIRRNESMVDSTVGVSGSIYALRRVLFRMIPADIILDDVLVPMTIARQGYRILFEPRALAYDRIVPSARAEFRRKVRTLAGNFQLFLRAHWVWNPRANRLWLQTLSHKFCRLLCPWFLLLAFCSNLLLWRLPVYRVLLCVQLI